MQNSSSNGKTIGIVVIVLIIIAGVWLMTRKSSDTTVMPAATTTTTTTSTTTATPATPTDPAVSNIQAGGSSNADLDSDSAAIDTQMQGLDSDNTNAQSTQ